MISRPSGRSDQIVGSDFTKGPFIYYVITCRRRGAGQKMPIFDY